MTNNYYLDIGTQLRKIRLEQRREIKDISNDSRISERYLEAIEAGDIKVFPSTVYYNLFARAYCKELGVNPDKLFVVSTEESLELEKVEASQDPLNQAEMRGLEFQVDEKKTVGRAVFWVGAVLILIIAVVIVFYLTEFADRESPPPVPQSPAGDTVISTDSGIVMPGEVIDSAMVVSAPQEPPKTEPVANPEIMTLRIEMHDSSWVLILADNDTALNRTLYSGDTRLVNARTRFLISAFNPGAMSLKLDDNPLRALSPLGRPVRNAEINRDNRNEFYSSPTRP